jgi:hypothetical protein
MAWWHKTEPRAPRYEYDAKYLGPRFFVVRNALRNGHITENEKRSLESLYWRLARRYF